jgi:hypothetical protein
MQLFNIRRKVAGLIPDEVTGIFNWPNLSSLKMAVGSTQPLTEMSIKILPGGEVRPARKAHRRLWADLLDNVGASTSYNPIDLQGLLQG